MAQGLERIFSKFEQKAANCFGGLKTSLSASTSGAQRELANCVAMLSNRVASAREASSVQPSAFASGMTAAASVAAPSTATGQSSKETS